MKKTIWILAAVAAICCACENGGGRQKTLTMTMADNRGWMDVAQFDSVHPTPFAQICASDTFRLHFYGWTQEEDSTFRVGLPETTAGFGTCWLEYTMLGWNQGPAEWDMTTQVMVKDKATGEWYELSRCITPYGGSFSKTWSKTYYLDVTPLMPLLEGETEFKIFYCGWDATEKRAHQVALRFCYSKGKQAYGTPSWHQKVYDSTLSGNTGYRSWAYGVEGYSIEDSARLGERHLTFPEGTKTIVLRSCFTGHGQDAYKGTGVFPTRDNYKAKNPAEFDYNEYHIVLNGDTLAQTGYIFEENSTNYKQAGTYKYDRCGWGPGKPCNVHWWVISLPKSMTDLTIDLNLDPYQSPNTEPNANSVAQFYVEVDAFGYK